MTIAATLPRAQYTATSGQTVFDYTWEIFATSDLVVSQNGVTLTEGSDYAVVGVSPTVGGTVTLVTGATAGDVITIYSDMPYERTTDFKTAGDFLTDALNTEFDRMIAMIKQISTAANRKIGISETDSITSLDIPALASRKGTVLGFNSSSGEMETVQVSGSSVISKDFCTASGSPNSLVLATSIGNAITAVLEGQSGWFIAPFTNTGAVDVTRDGVSLGGAQWNGAAMVGGEIQSGKAYSFYNDTLATIQIKPVGSDNFVGSGTGTYSRIVQDILRANALNVVQFMSPTQFADFLAGGTGSVDMTTAINNAITAAAAANKDVYFPGFTYPTSSQITVPTGSAVKLIGEGMARDQSKTCIQPSSAAVTTALYVNNTGNGSTHGFGMSHIAIDMVNMTTSGSIGLHIDANWYTDLDDIFITNIASATDNIGFQMNSASLAGSYISHWGAIKFYGGSTSGGTTGSVGLKLQGTSTNRVTSIVADILEFGGIETCISSDYTGAGISVRYFYPANTVTYGWVATNHTGADNLTVFGGEYDATSYNFSGAIDVFGGGVSGSGAFAASGTGVSYIDRGFGGKDAVTLSAATDTIDPVSPYIQLKSSSGSLTLTSNPQINAGYPGQKITLTGGNDSNFVVLSDGNGLNLKSSTIELRQYVSVALVYDNSFTNKWVEESRSVATGAYSATVAAAGTDNGRFFQGNLRELTFTGSTGTIGFPSDGNDGDIITYKIYNNSGGTLTTTWNYQFKKDSTYADPANGKYRLITFVKSADGFLYQVSCTGDI